jgi:hypothetical protein
MTRDCRYQQRHIADLSGILSVKQHNDHDFGIQHACAIVMLTCME